MPIFEKGRRRIYYAHIPKTGGTSIYSAFVGSGWTIKNLSEWNDPRSAFCILSERFGISQIDQEGWLWNYPHPAQHAPRYIWQTWGPFESSFTVCRHPFSRLASALHYHFRIKSSHSSFEDFAEEYLEKATRGRFQYLRLLGGHLIPQYHFVKRDTRVYRFEGEWSEQISREFGVGIPPRDNVSPRQHVSLSDGWRRFALRYYKEDFRRFCYSTSLLK